MAVVDDLLVGQVVGGLDVGWVVEGELIVDLVELLDRVDVVRISVGLRLRIDLGRWEFGHAVVDRRTDLLDHDIGTAAATCCNQGQQHTQCHQSNGIDHSPHTRSFDRVPSA